MANQLEKFESMDYLRKNEAYSEYREYWDNFDQKVKIANTRKFICRELPISNEMRRALLKEFDAPLV